MMANMKTSLAAFSLIGILFCAGAYDPLDPYGNITITWDILTWQYDTYIATVTVHNFQQYRHIEDPGWQLGWTWANTEIIWAMWGGQATHQGDCSAFRGMTLPHSCEKSPTIVDLLPSTPYNQQSANCCRGGVLSSWVQDPATSVSSFQLAVGRTGTTTKTVRVPQNFTFETPGLGYTCGPAKIVQPTEYPVNQGRRTIQAMMTWELTCTYSPFLAERTPKCCVSLSSFYNKAVTSCPVCSCGCPQNRTGCAKIDSKSLDNPSTVQCTNHMCPIQVHWHIQTSNKRYWRVKITVTNLKPHHNFSHWNLLLQHPNMNNITEVLGFSYKPLIPYNSSINDTGMFYGMEGDNDMLMAAGQDGFVQSEILMMKEKGFFTFKHGWGFPRRVYFNGDQCVQPSLPNFSYKAPSPTLSITMFTVFCWFFI